MCATDLRRRFFAKIAPAPDSECILWTGARRSNYGVACVAGKQRQATHVSWFLKYGVWPDQHILHRCDNPICVNPDHLFEGTDADNAADRDAKGRHRVLSGEEAPWTRLTGLEVSEIVALTDTRMTNAEIGALFDVGAAYVSSLRHGRYRTAPAGRNRKPRGCRRYLIDGVEMTIDEIAARAGVGRATIEMRISRGITGSGLLARKHKGVRKPYTRMK